MIFEIDNVLVSSALFTECFACELSSCLGRCCVEGVSGAPVTLEEVEALEECAELLWGDLSESAREVIERQGVVYSDKDGDLVTSIINDKECIFAQRNAEGCCLCMIEEAFNEGKTSFAKPISCALYPLREKKLSTGMIGLNYEKLPLCAPACAKGKSEGVALYIFLREPLLRRFGQEWYDDLVAVANAVKENKV